MDAKKVLGWLALAFVLLWIFTAPRAAADFFEAIGSGIHGAAMNTITFFRDLSS